LPSVTALLGLSHDWVMDSILPPVVVSVINSALGSLKNARELAKEHSDSNLKEQLSAVYDHFLELKDRVLQLDEDNRLLKAQLSQKANLTFDAEHGYYFAEGDPTPSALSVSRTPASSTTCHLPNAGTLGWGNLECGEYAEYAALSILTLLLELNQRSCKYPECAHRMHRLAASTSRTSRASRP